MLGFLWRRAHSPSSHIRSIESISSITDWTTQRTEALTHPLRFLHFQLKGSGTLIDLLQLGEMTVENSDDLGELHQNARLAISFGSAEADLQDRLLCLSC